MPESAMAAKVYDAVVVGAGVVGMTVAHRLARAGLQTCIVDRAPSVAHGSSFMSSGQIDPCRIDHLKDYGDPKALGLAGVVQVVRGHPRWTLNYVAYRLRIARDQALAQRLTEDIRALGRRAVGIASDDFGGIARGIFRLGRSTILRDCTFPLDPADATLHSKLEYRPYEIATGSPRHLCARLAAECTAMGADILLNTAVTDVRAAGPAVHGAPTVRATQVVTGGGAVNADRVIFCLGIDSDRYFPHVPIWGCIRELNFMGDSAGLFGTDDVIMASLPSPGAGQQAYVCLLETDGKRTLRLGGGAVISRTTPSIEAFGGIPHRLVGHGEPLQDWIGYRAVAPDGAPILGKLPGYENVYVNCGHSFWGWTLSFGCAELLGDHIVHGEPIPSTFAPSRFAV